VGHPQRPFLRPIVDGVDGEGRRIQERWQNGSQRQAVRSADRIQQDCAGPQTDKGYGERAGHGLGRGGEQRHGVETGEESEVEREETEADQEEGEEQSKLLRQSSRKVLNILFLMLRA
jgi:hypothetical protein